MMRTMWGALALMGLGACAGPYDDLGFIDDPVPIPNDPDLGTREVHDLVVQLDEPKVDILWIVDNSGSMQPYQDQIANNFDAFLRYFLESGMDWHLGLVSTDTDDEASSGVLYQSEGHRFVSRETVGAEDVFVSMVQQLGTVGSGTERGFRAVDRFFEKLNTANRGFFREEAAFHAIVVSDETEQSGNDPSQPEFIEMMRNLKADPDMVTFSSIVGPNPSGCTTETGAPAMAAPRYISATEQIGGMHHSICEEDWVPILRELGLQAAGMRVEYFLSEAPDPASLQVWAVVPPLDDGGEPYVYDGIPVHVAEGQDRFEACPAGTCFTYEYNPVRNSITLMDYVPPALTEMHMTYEVLSEKEPEFEDFEAPSP